MTLDAYYRLRYYSTVLRATAEPLSSIAVPSTTMCDGTKKTALYRGYGFSSGYYDGLRCAYAPPYSGMKSQADGYIIYSSDFWVPSNILVGTGTTPPTAADYCMENELVDELTFQSVATRVYDDGRLVYFKTMTNNSGETLTITEVGLSEGWMNNATLSTGNPKPQVLVMREVLEEPIVVAPGGTFTVSVTHKFQIA